MKLLVILFIGCSLGFSPYSAFAFMPSNLDAPLDEMVVVMPSNTFKNTTKPDQYGERIRYDVTLRDLNSATQEANLDNVYETIIKADGNDTVVIHIMSNGGHSELGNAIARAIINSNARIVADIQTTAYSAAALVAMVTKELVIGNDSTFLFHKAKLAYFADGSKRAANITDPGVAAYYVLAEDYIFPYLTKNEIKRFVDGEDVYISGKVLKERLGERVITLDEI